MQVMMFQLNDLLDLNIYIFVFFFDDDDDEIVVDYVLFCILLTVKQTEIEIDLCK